MNARITTALLLAAVALACTAAAADAGSYHVYSCRTPAGEGAPADGWVGSKVGTYTYAEDTCGQPNGALVAALGDQAARTANTDSATWAFATPAGEHISAATLWRAGDAAGGAAVNATYQFWLAGPGEAEVFDQCSFLSGCTGGRGEPASRLAPVNRVEVPPANRGSHLYVKAACGGVAEFKCKENQGDANNYAAVVYLFAADLTLEQLEGPTAGNVSGELASAPSVAGTSDVAFSASDPGSGVYEAIFTVDGQVLQRTVLDEAGGRCRDVGGASDGLPAFLYVKPCLASLSSDVAFDTTRLANGTHHLQVSVIDAAGNSTPVLDRNIAVANPVPPGAANAAAGAGVQGAGPPNGTGASEHATLAVAWKGSRGARLSSGFGRAHVATGRLTGPGGSPIGGAQIDVVATPAFAGAQAAAMAAPRTAADGRFTLRVPGGVSSRTLRFSYRAHLGDPVPAATRTLALSVSAGVRLSIAPRASSVGGRISFSGRLLGGPVPQSGKLLVLEARSGGRSWIKFNVVRSDRRGRYRSSYRFKFPGPATYRFRVVSEPEADYPYAGGASNQVTVLER